MARGESPKERPLSIGLALVAVLVVATICAVSAVVASIRSTNPYTTPYVPPSTEPFRGATSAFGTLGSRDSARAMLVAGATLTRDPIAARSTMESTLRDRGYVLGTTTETSAAPLPLDATPSDLDGACGVVLLVGDVSTTISGAGIAGGTTYHAVDPSAFTVAMCGAQPMHVEGAGNVTYRTWLFPGITPAATTTTGLSADALLGHAEMETLLRRRGYAPVDEIVSTTPTATTAGGFVTMTMPTIPAAGCIPFVAYVEGAGRPQITPGRFDYLDDRGIVGAVACATSTNAWEPLAIDDSTVGARVWWRAYGVAPSGTTGVISIGGATPTDAAHATWPTSITESP